MAFQDKAFAALIIDALAESYIATNLVRSVTSTDGISKVGGSVEFKSSGLPEDILVKTQDDADRAARKALEVDVLTESYDNLRLQVFAYLSIAIPYELNTMTEVDITDLARQIAARVAAYSEAYVLNAMDTASTLPGGNPVITSTAAPESVVPAINQARAVLNVNKAIERNRSISVASDVAQLLLNSETFRKNPQLSGEGNNPLRSGIIGAVSGALVVENPAQRAGTAFMLQRDAIVRGVKPLKAAKGATQSFTLIAPNADAVGFHSGYSVDFAEDRVTGGHFMGVKTVRPSHVQEINFSG